MWVSVFSFLASVERESVSRIRGSTPSAHLASRWQRAQDAPLSGW